MRRLLLACLATLYCATVQAQIQQLATSGDGSILLLRSSFRLKSETDVAAQAKVYRWQNGAWTRLTAAADNIPAVSVPDVFEPFLSTDARIIGWQINIGCFLCQVIVAPPQSSEITGVSLPSTFPRGGMKMSSNGRYFMADSYPFNGAKYLDSETGAVADVPVDLFARPVRREVANDGTALLLLTSPADRTQNIAPGTLTLWKPDSDPRAIYSENRTFDSIISASTGRVAFESVIEGGPDDDQRTLIVWTLRPGSELQSPPCLPKTIARRSKASPSGFGT